MNERLWSVKYVLVVNAISCLLLAVMGIAYTTVVDNRRAADERQNDREWCDIVVFYDDFYGAHPERITTEEQRHFVDLMNTRRKNLDCK